MKNARDMHNMLHKRPLSADGAGVGVGGGAGSEAKRSPRLLMMTGDRDRDRDRMRLHSPLEHCDEEDDEEELLLQEEEASDMRMATTTDEDAEEERERLRDSKRNIKLLHNVSIGRHEEELQQQHRPRSHQQHLESGEWGTG